MAGLPNESSTTINPGIGGDKVRDLALTADDATTVKQQVVTIADPLDLDGVARVGSRGLSTSDDDANTTLLLILAELRAIRLTLAALSTGSNFDDLAEVLDLLNL